MGQYLAVEGKSCEPSAWDRPASHATWLSECAAGYHGICSVMCELATFKYGGLEHWEGLTYLASLFDAHVRAGLLDRCEAPTMHHRPYSFADSLI